VARFWTISDISPLWCLSAGGYENAIHQSVHEVAHIEYLWLPRGDGVGEFTLSHLPNFGRVQSYGLCQLCRECGYHIVWVNILRGVTKQRDVEMIAIHICSYTDRLQEPKNRNPRYNLSIEPGTLECLVWPSSSVFYLSYTWSVSRCERGPTLRCKTGLRSLRLAGPRVRTRGGGSIHDLTYFENLCGVILFAAFREFHLLADAHVLTHPKLWFA